MRQMWTIKKSIHSVFAKLKSDGLVLDGLAATCITLGKHAWGELMNAMTSLFYQHSQNQCMSGRVFNAWDKVPRVLLQLYFGQAVILGQVHLRKSLVKHSPSSTPRTTRIIKPLLAILKHMVERTCAAAKKHGTNRSFIATDSAAMPSEQNLLPDGLVVLDNLFKSGNALPDQKHCHLDLISPVILIFQVVTELILPAVFNFQVIPEIVCRRLSPSLLSMWVALFPGASVINQVKGPNQVIIKQVMK